MAEGGCQCGAIRYAVTGAAEHSAICHCNDCRRSAGAPVVSFAAFPEEGFRLIQGTPVDYNSSGASVRSFCGTCGTSLFFRNAEFLPGIVDIHSATLDDPMDYAPDAQIQLAERLPYMAQLDAMAGFDRYPGM